MGQALNRLGGRLEVDQIVSSLLGPLDFITKLSIRPALRVDKLRRVLLEELVDMTLEARPVLGGQVRVKKEHPLVQLRFLIEL